MVAAWALVGGVVEVIAGFGSGEAAGTRQLGKSFRPLSELKDAA